MFKLRQVTRSFFLLALLANHPYVFAGTPPPKLVKTINSLLKNMHIPGASVAVIENGHIDWAKGFGYASIKEKRPVATNTLFQAASITKTLTSAATLKVLENHQIALDEAVNRHLNDWQIPENQYTKKVPVTFRMLLSHTGAISNPYPDGGYGPYAKLPTLLQLLNGEKPATNPPLRVTRVPGTKFEYCNGCYTILQAALEDMTQSTYPKLMQRLILTPANMSHSYFDNELYIHKKEQVALPYSPDLTTFKNAPTRSPIFATGYLWTTATDLATYNLAITKSLNNNSGIVSKAQALKMITPGQSPTHGLAYFIGNKQGQEKACGHYIFHSGSNIGYLSLSIINKDGQQGAVILINISPSWNAKDYPQYDFITKSLNAISSHYHWV